MKHEVSMFDVGHGDCVLIMDSLGKGLVVDCGSLNPHLYYPVPCVIENLLPLRNKCGFIVSHYHSDHFSLFRWFKNPNKLFSNIYLPDLPVKGLGRQAAFAIMEFLKVSIFANFSHYRILPQIFAETRRPVVYCKKGNMIKEAGLHLRVIWPDLRHSVLRTKKIDKKANAVRVAIEPLFDRFNIPRPTCDSRYSMKKFFEELEKEEIQYREPPKQAEDISRVLGKVEKGFQDLANIFSIAFKSYYKDKTSFLFLGDLQRNILNQISIPGTRAFDCVKAAHHGTEFGKALKGKSTEFLLVSRNRRRRKIKNIHEGYILDMRYGVLLSTEYLGDCYII